MVNGVNEAVLVALVAVMTMCPCRSFVEGGRCSLKGALLMSKCAMRVAGDLKITTVLLPIPWVE